MSMLFDGKVIVVTGGASGIGEGIVREFAREGGRTAVLDIDAERGEQVARELRRDGHETLFVRTDVAEEAEVTAAVHQVTATWGRIDALVNNAGVDFKKGLQMTSVAEWDRIMGINLRSVYLMSKYCSLQMQTSTVKSIVNISSVHALETIPNADAYAAAKGGVVSLTRSMALSLQQDGIRVNGVCPGYIPTPMWERSAASDEELEQYKRHAASFHPVGRLGTPRDVARTCIFLSSDDAGFINGQVIAVDGGVTIRLMT